MKSSRYNHFYDIEGGIILAFNSYTGALAEIEPENYPRVQYLLEHPDRLETDQDREFRKHLVAGGYLIADAIDERAVLQAKSLQYRRNTAILTLTVAPTLACNFACDYCFESHSAIRMSRETETALLAFCERRLGQAEKLRLCWFGGEPTLCLNTIERLQTGMQDLADRYQVDVLPGTIITNGYLLDADMARRLKQHGISRVQVTLDGPEKIHDRRRKLRNGKGTFRKIVDNLADTADVLTINIRINIDQDNVDSAYEVVELLQQRNLLAKVTIDFAQVVSRGTACADIRDRCFSEQEFARTLVGIYEWLGDRGIFQVDYPRVFAGAVFCGALSDGYFVVSPTGHLFKCWEELALDPAQSVGDVFSESPDERQRKNLETYRAWDPFAMTECWDCDILPICMAGCPVHVRDRTETTGGICSPWRYNLREMIRLKYLGETRKEVRR